MSKRKREILESCTREQLVYIIESYEKSLYNICEICVEESKWHIESSDAVSQIRNHLSVLNDLSYIDMQHKLDLFMGKISVQEYRKRIGLD